MYHTPKLTGSSTSSENSKRHILALTATKQGLPAALAKKVPARFPKNKGALAGDRGAKLVLHGDTTMLVMGLGSLESFTPQEAAEWGENAAHALIKENVDSVQVVFPDALTDRDVLINFLK